MFSPLAPGRKSASAPLMWATLGLIAMAFGCNAQQAVTPNAAQAATVDPTAAGNGQPPVATADTNTADGTVATPQPNSATEPDTSAPHGDDALALADEVAQSGGATSTTGKATSQRPAKLPENPFPRRIEAPGLEGGVGWINTAGPLELRQLRGKFVMLDFWTYCCINCMHVLPELKKLEHAYPNNLVVIGVHSAKFENEAETKNIIDAVLRYEIEHPVVNDAKHAIWNTYGIRSWPSLLLIDPEGYLVAYRPGESTFEDWDETLRKGIEYYRAKGVLDEKPLRFDLEAYKVESTPLRYPGKVLADAAGDRLLIADSNHNRIVVTRLDGTLLETIGSGAIGAADGDFATAQFNKPQGMALLDETLYVADTENHLLRKIDLQAKTVSTIAGRGHQGRVAWPGLSERLAANKPPPKRWVGKPLTTALNSPWDLYIHDKFMYIAMAGPHQIWRMPLSEAEIGPYAGNGAEDILDGPLLPKTPYESGYSAFAQPSGLAGDDKWLYVADSEGSSIRAVPFDPTKKVQTVVGTAHLEFARLFVFGDVDGNAKTARLQHPLCVAYQDNKLYVADTYNNKIKVIDLPSRECTTLVGTGEAGLADDPPQFDELAGLSIAGDRLYVADTNNHAIRVVDLAAGNKVTTLEIAGLEPPAVAEPTAPPTDDWQVVELAPQRVRAVDEDGLFVRLKTELTLPGDFKINTLAPMTWQAAGLGDSAELVAAAAADRTKVDSPGVEVELRLPVSATSGKTTAQVDLVYYYCREGAEGICKQATVRWKLPLELSPDGAAEAIVLRHTAEP